MESGEGHRELESRQKSGIGLRELWLQDHCPGGKADIAKVRGDDNFSDSPTKHASADRIWQTLLCACRAIALRRVVVRLYAPIVNYWGACGFIVAVASIGGVLADS